MICQSPSGHTQITWNYSLARRCLGRLLLTDWRGAPVKVTHRIRNCFGTAIHQRCWYIYLEEEIKLFVRLTWQIKLETYDISTRMILFLRSEGSFRLSQKRRWKRKRSKRSVLDQCEWTLSSNFDETCIWQIGTWKKTVVYSGWRKPQLTQWHCERMFFYISRRSTTEKNTCFLNVDYKVKCIACISFNKQYICMFSLKTNEADKIPHCSLRVNLHLAYLSRNFVALNDQVLHFLSIHTKTTIWNSV